MILVAPDPEVIIPAALEQRLETDYPGIFVGRDLPEPLPPLAVSVMRAGGTSRSRMLDTARLQVRVFATSEHLANQLAERVRAELEALDGVHPFKRTSADGPTPIESSDTPLRLISASVTIRKVQL